MSLLHRTSLFLIAALAYAAPAWCQGLYWETNNTGGPGGPQTAKFWAMPKMMKIVGADGRAVILRSDQDKIISLDAEKKSYWELTFDELEAMSKQMHTQMDAAMAQMKAKMKDLPPEQRAAIEKMMPKGEGNEGDKKQPPVAVKATGETRKIDGYSCSKYVASEGADTILVAWTTDDIKAFAPMREDFIALQKRLNDTNRAFRSGLAEAYTKITGFPMETEVGVMKSVVTKVEPRDIPASEFAPPAGFTKESPPSAKQQKP